VSPGIVDQSINVHGHRLKRAIQFCYNAILDRRCDRGTHRTARENVGASGLPFGHSDFEIKFVLIDRQSESRADVIVIRGWQTCSVSGTMSADTVTSVRRPFAAVFNTGAFEYKGLDLVLRNKRYRSGEDGEKNC